MMSLLKANCNLKGIVSAVIGTGLSHFKILGQEQDGGLIVSWVKKENTTIGIVYIDSKILQILNTFGQVLNIIQASVNARKTVIVFVTKDEVLNENKEENGPDLYLYKLYIKPIFLDEIKLQRTTTYEASSSHQIMAQFLYKKKQTGAEKFLVFIHQHSITLYQLQINEEDNNEENIINNQQFIKHSLVDTVVKVFSWAQWDSDHQCLFYIHYRKSSVRVEGEDIGEENQSPTLSALHFNDDTPHETVLNIPLNLPPPLLDSPCNTYEDNPIPLRVHDCTLNVTVLTNKRGVICICHHYLYQPVQVPMINSSAVDENTTVHLAYSVTLLHHGTVIHCTMPGIPWVEASQVKPIFTILEDEHMVVYSPGVFLHLLDMGPGHEPCCHIILPNNSPNTDQWAVLKDNSNSASIISLSSFEISHLRIEPNILINAYRDPSTQLSNKLSILHYLLIHCNDYDTVSELLMPIADDCLKSSTHKIFHEVLISGAFASVLKSLPSDAIPLLRFLPLTSINPSSSIEIKVKGHVMTISHEALWNPAVMLLSPRQRLCPLHVDLWTKLWDLIAASANIVRFKPTTVVEKLMVSLVCYQPEALSRCSTPLSPGSGFSSSSALADMASIASGRMKPQLPFYEVEKCTASKQEHIISVNLRELSMHLVKYGRESPMQVHAVATRHAAAQLEMSRFLCSLVTKSAGVSTQFSKGFQLVNDLSPAKRMILFSMLERFVQAIDALAYPLPQGFSSFFTYLGYCTLPIDNFLQYVQANVLQLQIDVMKAILTDVGNTSEAVRQKLRLLMLLPRSRAKRLLNQWSHPASMMIRAREHSANILSGLETRTHPHRTKSHSNAGLSAFYSADRISPLDTFLDLLTAKASLAELDFNLLVEATISSTQDFLD